MMRLGTILLVMLIGLVHALSGDALDLPTQEAERPESAPFPIVTRFELPRDYGYFIGDEIPLTLTIDTHQGIVIDLVNLPRQGEQHGLFEIRALSITTTTTAERHTIHRAAYTLQYFGAAPLTAQFKPLEILYAHAAEGKPRSKRITHYKSLFTQPVVINISRIGPYHTSQALDTKGPLPDRRQSLIWIPSLLGLSLLTASVYGWTKEWSRTRKCFRRADQTQRSALEQALQALRDNEANLSTLGVQGGSSQVYVGRIIREYLHHTFDVPAFALTVKELSQQLAGTPHVEEILHVLERCDLMKYQPVNDATTDRRQLWQDTLAVFENLAQEEAA